MLYQADLHMLDMENQLESVAAPPPEPVIPPPKDGENHHEIHGESGVESGSASP